MAVIMNMLAKPGALKALEEAREMLEKVTPLKINCGKLCGGVSRLAAKLLRSISACAQIAQRFVYIWLDKDPPLKSGKLWEYYTIFNGKSIVCFLERGLWSRKKAGGIRRKVPFVYKISVVITVKW